MERVTGVPRPGKSIETERACFQTLHVSLTFWALVHYPRELLRNKHSTLSTCSPYKLEHQYPAFPSPQPVHWFPVQYPKGDEKYFPISTKSPSKVPVHTCYPIPFEILIFYSTQIQDPSTPESYKYIPSRDQIPKSEKRKQTFLL